MGVVQCVTVFIYWIQVPELEKNHRQKGFTEFTQHSLTDCGVILLPREVLPTPALPKKSQAKTTLASLSLCWDLSYYLQDKMELIFITIY